MNLNREMKEMKAKERKLREGITRNSRDHATVEKLKKSLSKCREDIQKLANRQQRVHNEMDGRVRKKDIF